MLHRLAAFTAVLTLTAACLDQPTSQLGQPRLAISDGANGGNAGFFFLPPMVPNPEEGENDTTASPVVVICEWDGAACVTTLATFTTDLATTTTTQPGNSETVRRGEDHFIVNWHTDAYALDPALTYRISVQVEGVEQGFADVDVVESGGQLKDVAEGFVGVVNGRTLPIKFRVESVESPE